jgi:hypothetical protein
MPRFLIEVPHESGGHACIKAIDVIRKTGAHFFSKADWGCKDGEHKAWLIVDVKDKNEALCIVPVSFRRDARIVQLNAFSDEEVDHLLGSAAS